MSDVAKRIIQNVIAEHNGQVSMDVLKEEILERRDVSEDTAEFYITNYAEKEKQADGTVLCSVKGSSASQSQMPDRGEQTSSSIGTPTAGSITEVGEPTTDTFGNLTVLEDVNHPAVPTGYEEGYYRRRINKKSDVQIVTTALEKGLNVLLIGEKGVGKGELFKHVAAKTNRAHRQVNFSKDIRVENLLGHYELIDGDTVWIDGILTRAAREGAIFQADEMNAAGGAVTMALHSVAEKPENRLLTIPQTGETIKPHPEFRLVGTQNPMYAGTRQQNQAFRSRFVSIELDYISEDREVNVVFDNTDLDRDRHEEKIRALVQLANDLREDYQEGTISTTISPRALIHVATFMEDDFMDAKSAAKMALKGVVGEEDKEAIDKVIDNNKDLS